MNNQHYNDCQFVNLNLIPIFVLQIQTQIFSLQILTFSEILKILSSQIQLLQDMLKQRNVQHRRKNSQFNLFDPNYNQKTYSEHIKHQQKDQSKNKKKKTIQKQNINKYQKSNLNKLKLSINHQNQIQNQHNQAKNIFKLLENSQRRISKKATVIDHINEQNDQNIDKSNGNQESYSFPDSNNENTLYDPYFQFGRKSRSSIQKNNQNYYSMLNANNNYYNYLNMQEIVEVPDTMSNQRRYQNNNNFYQFTTSEQNSLANFSNKLTDKKDFTNDNSKQHEQEDRTCLNTFQQLKALKNNKYKLQKMKNLQQQMHEQNKKNLKQRKQKGPKNIVIQTVQNQNKSDISSFMHEFKNMKPLCKNIKKDGKRSKSKSKQLIKKVQRQKSGTSLLSNKKFKNMSHATLAKKKSLSLKNQKKSCILKLSVQGQTSTNKKSDKVRYDQNILQHANKIHQTNTNNAVVSKKLKQDKSYISIGQKIMMIQQSQSKLQNQYKVLWQCVGQLWQNSRVTRYISEKNKSDIIKLRNNQKSQDQKLIKLKSQIISSISSARY